MARNIAVAWINPFHISDIRVIRGEDILKRTATWRLAVQIAGDAGKQELMKRMK